MDNPYYGLSALRHRRQQASLIGQLDGLGLLAPGHCYVEMGAGKGQLSHWVRQAVSSHDDAAFLLVDRSSIRYKVDGYHKEEEKVKFERVKVDIEHLNLGKVPMVANSARPLVAIGKHLCGAATDLTLRCLMKTVGSRSADLSSPEPRIKRMRTTVNAEKPSDCAGVAKSQSLPGNSVAGSGDAAASVAREGGRQGTVCGTAPAEGQTAVESGHGEHTQTSKCAADGEHIQTSKCAGHSEHTQTSKCAADGEHTQTSKCAGHSEHTQTSKCAAEGGRSVSNSNTAQGVNVTADNPVVGVLIALCCHHQCRWQAYVGKEFMRQCGITAADFSLLTRLSSWAVCGWRDRDGSFGTKKGGSAADKEVGSDGTTIRSAQQNDPADGATIRSAQQSDPADGATIRSAQQSDPADGATIRSAQQSNPADGATIRSAQQSDPADGTTIRSAQQSNPADGATIWSAQQSNPADGATIRSAQESDPADGTTIQSAQESDPADGTTIQSAQQSDPADGSTSVVEEEMEHNTEDLVRDTNKTGDLQLSEKEKEAVGWRCKRLIDYGRALYLRRRGLHSDLKVYIDSQQTPENVVLIAKPSEKT